MKEPIIRELSDPVEKPSLRASSLQSLSAAVRSLKPSTTPSPPGQTPVVPVVKRHRGRAVLAALTATCVALATWWQFDDDAPQKNAEPIVVSGKPRLKLTRDGNYIRWHARELELSIDPSIAQLGPTANDALLLAFDAWQAEHPNLPALTINVASSPRTAELDGVNLVTYAPIEVPRYHHALAVTMAYTRPDGEIIEADVVVNSRIEFATLGTPDPSGHEDPRNGEHEADDLDMARKVQNDCRNRYDLQSVVAHEAGHFLGLGEDEVDTEATMYYKTSRCDTKQRDLAPGDIEAVQIVYDQPPEGDENRSAACSLAHRRELGPTWLLLVVTFGLRLRRHDSLGARSRV